MAENKQPKQKKVLIAALDWGLGHATRMVPIIKYFIDLKYEVAIASSSSSLDFLKINFPNLKTYNLQAYNIQYNYKSLIFSIIVQIPKIVKTIKKEHKQTQDIVKEFKPDIIISDNRYGVYSKSITSIFITHQLQILPPKHFGFISPLLLKLHQKMMKNFNEIWVPDYEDITKNIAGKMSHISNKYLKIKYIGALSRFNTHNLISTENSINKMPKILVIISGPEPSRTNFEKILIQQLKNYKGESVVLQGLPSIKNKIVVDNVTIYNHLEDEEIEFLLKNTDLVICRSGYSTIMDLLFWKKNAVLIPTPNQSEQIYLAEKLKKEGVFYSQFQNKINIEECIKQSKNYNGFSNIIDEKSNTIFEVINSLEN